MIVPKETIGAGLPMNTTVQATCPIHIPSLITSLPYKTEIREFFLPEGVEMVLKPEEETFIISEIKRNFWHGEDDRMHNHPWKFFLTQIISGGYTEIRGQKVNGEFDAIRCKLKEGDWNIVYHDTFHKVVNVQPGTKTIMYCGPRVGQDEDKEPGEWGYLDMNGEYFKAEKDMRFLELFWQFNPFMRPPVK